MPSLSITQNVDVDSLLAELQALRETVAEKDETIARQQADLEDYQQKLEASVEMEDVIERCLRNKKMSPTYQKAYIFLIKKYPDLLKGISSTISIKAIREAAGESISEESMTKFFQDMQACGYLVYHSGVYDAEKNEREGYVVPGPDFDCPENFDTKSTEKRKKARDAEQEKRDRYRVLLGACENCSSPDLVYDLHPICRSCGHKHMPIIAVEESRMTVKPAEEEDVDPFEEWAKVSPPEPAEKTNNLLNLPEPEQPAPAMVVGTTPPPPNYCIVKATHRKGFRWNGARWVCKECHPL